MLSAFGWGLVAASSLVLGAVVALLVTIPARVVGLVMGFGSGVLISAVAFDLVEEATGVSSGATSVAVGLFAGCLVFFAGDTWIERRGGGDRKSSTGEQSEGSAQGIVLGTVLDGIPESLVIGLTLALGDSIGVAYLVAVFVSNVPESLSSTAGLVAGGWRRSRVMAMWVVVALVSALASAAGYGLADGASPDVEAFVLAFAGGAVLTMLADTMMPEAFEKGGRLAGVVTTLGFAVAFALHQYA